MSGHDFVTIIDDDQAMRESLATLLRAEGFVTQSYESAECFLADGPESVSGCLIVDIHMPGMNGLDLQRELRARAIALPVLVITGQADVPKAVAALKAGAIDFLEKPYDIDALLRAVRDALNREDRGQNPDDERWQVQLRLASLSRREREVMDLMVKGNPNKRIAATLGISPRTVENHRASVMDKMQCANLSSLIHLILRLN